MGLLDDLAACLGEQTAMTVTKAVLLVSSTKGPPRARMSTKNSTYHALFAGPAGLFFADLDAPSSGGFFTSLASDKVSVDDYQRVDKEDRDAMAIEGNWPSKKVRIFDAYFAVPRNFTGDLDAVLNEELKRKRRR